MATAAEQVFAVPELLESILLQLPNKDTLLVQQVNTTFKDAIKSWTKIQRKLLFKPRPTDTEVEFNPLFEKVLNLHGMRIVSPPTLIEENDYTPMLTESQDSPVYSMVVEVITESGPVKETPPGTLRWMWLSNLPCKLEIKSRCGCKMVVGSIEGEVMGLVQTVRSMCHTFDCDCDRTVREEDRFVTEYGNDDGEIRMDEVPFKWRRNTC